jgi:hypothetical protein
MESATAKIFFIFITGNDQEMYVRSEVFTAVTMKNAAFWDVTPCSSCVNRRLGGTYLLPSPHYCFSHVAQSPSLPVLT